VVRLGANEGLAEALNFGLRYVRTEWVVRADADDYNLPQRFARISEFLAAHPELDLVGSALLELERTASRWLGESCPCTTSKYENS
jgi:glycosyltransferase involved in cell wall biosynthesis